MSDPDNRDDLKRKDTYSIINGDFRDLTPTNNSKERIVHPSDETSAPESLRVQLWALESAVRSRNKMIGHLQSRNRDSLKNIRVIKEKLGVVEVK